MKDNLEDDDSQIIQGNDNPQDEKGEDERYDYTESRVKNKYECWEIEDIQQGIQEITKKIEHEKINKRICDERYEKKLGDYNRLQGKPIALSKDQKDKERKEKMEQNKKRKMDQPRKTGRAALYNEVSEKKEKEVRKYEVDLEMITKSINEVNLQNKELKNQISNWRKQKESAVQQLEMTQAKNEKIEEDIQDVKQKNEEIREEMRENEDEALEEKFSESNQWRTTFLNERDNLELQYHRIIEANIQRERERKMEQSKKRQLVGAMAQNALTKKTKTGGPKSLDEQVKSIQNEDISDRTPCWDVIWEKWKFVNKYKKNMIEKYIKNADSIKEAFSRIMKFLGIDDYDELPIIYEKTIEQTASIEMYISSLTNTLNQREERKKLLQQQIDVLKKKIAESSEIKKNFSELKQASILRLQESIDEVNKSIEDKRRYFLMLKPETDKFLSRLEKTYLSDYIPNRMPLFDLNYNEDTIRSIFDNIQNYYKWIDLFEKSVTESNEDAINNNLNMLRLEMKIKLDNYKRVNWAAIPAMTKGKGDKGIGNYFEMIQKSANNVIDKVSNMSLAQAAPSKHMQFK